MRRSLRLIILAVIVLALVSVVMSGLTVGQRTLPTKTPTLFLKIPTATPTPAPIPATPASIAVELSEGSLTPDGKASVLVTARLYYANGSPVADDTRVNFQIDEAGWTQQAGPGYIWPVGSVAWGLQSINGVATKGGAASISYGNVSPQFAGTTVKVKVVAQANRFVQATAVVSIRSLAIRLEASQGHVTTDRSDSVTVTAHVTDSQGSPVADDNRVNFQIDEAGRTQQAGPGYIWIGTVPTWGLQSINGAETKGGAVSIYYGNVSPQFAGTTVKIAAVLSKNKAVTASLVLDLTPADSAPPVTTLALDKTAGSAGQYSSPVQVTLSASDGSGSGVKATEYGFDGDTWNAYAGPFSVSATGMNTVYYRSTDKAENQETPKLKAISIAAVSEATATPAATLLGPDQGTTTPTATEPATATPDQLATPTASAANNTTVTGQPTVEPSVKRITTGGLSWLVYLGVGLVLLLIGGRRRKC